MDRESGLMSGAVAYGPEPLGNRRPTYCGAVAMRRLVTGCPSFRNRTHACQLLTSLFEYARLGKFEHFLAVQPCLPLVRRHTQTCRDSRAPCRMFWAPPIDRPAIARLSRPGATRKVFSTIGIRSVSIISVKAELTIDPRPRGLELARRPARRLALEPVRRPPA